MPAAHCHMRHAAVAGHRGSPPLHPRVSDVFARLFDSSFWMIISKRFQSMWRHTDARRSMCRPAPDLSALSALTALRLNNLGICSMRSAVMLPPSLVRLQLHEPLPEVGPPWWLGERPLRHRRLRNCLRALPHDFAKALSRLTALDLTAADWSAGMFRSACLCFILLVLASAVLQLPVGKAEFLQQLKSWLEAHFGVSGLPAGLVELRLVGEEPPQPHQPMLTRWCGARGSLPPNLRAAHSPHWLGPLDASINLEVGLLCCARWSTHSQL